MSHNFHQRHSHGGVAASAAAPRVDAVDWAALLPPLVQQRAASLGRPGQDWLAGLPALVADLEQLWSVTVGTPYGGGSAALVAPVRTKSGGEAVIKIAVPDSGLQRESEILGRAQGRGYARLIASDVDRSATLQEALGPSLDELGLRPDRQIEILCGVLRRAWELQPEAEPTQAEVEQGARGLHELVSRLWVDLDRPCSAHVVDRALRYAERRIAAAGPEHAVVVHGDAHPANALRAPTARAGAEQGFVFVDPVGFLNDPAYDLGVVLRNWCPELLAGNAPRVAGGFCRLLAVHSGISEQAIWEWGFLERVSTGLHLMEIGAEKPGRQYLATAELLANVHHSNPQKGGGGRPWRADRNAGSRSGRQP